MDYFIDKNCETTVNNDMYVYDRYYVYDMLSNRLFYTS